MPQQRDAIVAISPPWLTLGTKGETPGNGGRYIYTMGLALDALLEKSNQAQQAHMPGHGDVSFIPYLAADRVMQQGPAESDASFSLRLQKSFSTWQHAGSRLSILGQIQAYLVNLQPGVDPELPGILIVGARFEVSTWDIKKVGDSPDLPPTHIRVDGVSRWDWDADGIYRQWEVWLVIFQHYVTTGITGTTATVSSTGPSGAPTVTTGFATMTGVTGATTDNILDFIVVTGASNSANNGTFEIVDVPIPGTVIVANPDAVFPDGASGAISCEIFHYPFIGPGPVWGATFAEWGDTDRSWDLNVIHDIIDSIRNILKTWKSANSYYPKIIISFGGGDGSFGDECSPASVPGFGNPDGNFSSYGVNISGVWTPQEHLVNPFTAFTDGTGEYHECSVHNAT